MLYVYCGWVWADVDIPWFGLVGLNVQTRYFMENYQAANEEEFDGLVFHLNWFKPAIFFGDNFISFQGYLDYEFLSRLGGDDDSIGGDDYGRSAESFQAYLGFWYHTKRYAAGYGAKLYKDMTQFKDGAEFFGSEIDSTGIAHYFNITYKF